MQFVLSLRLDRKSLDSPGHAHSETNPSPEGLKAGTLSSFIIRDKSFTGSRCHSATLTRSYRGFSMTFWTLILQGFLISPLHTLMCSHGVLQRCWSGPLTWNKWHSASFPCLVVGHEGYPMIHWDSVCVYICITLCHVWACSALLPKSVSVLTFSRRGMTEWSSRSSPHLPQRLFVVTFCQTTGNPGRPDPPPPLLLLPPMPCLFKKKVGQLSLETTWDFKRKRIIIQRAWLKLVIVSV